jgi:cysteinyl-tRNA synthetase
MAQVWMHNGFLQVEGEKMAKSAGNFVTIRDLRKGWQGYAWPGEALRFNMLRAHYRQPLDWTLQSLDESHKILWDWYDSARDVQPSKEPPRRLIDALADDLNTPQAIAELHDLRKRNRLPELFGALQFLGFSGKKQEIQRYADATAHIGMTFTVTGVGKAVASGISSERVDRLVTARNAAREAKNFKEADRIRDELAKMGVVLKDNKDGTTTWEVAR